MRRRYLIPGPVLIGFSELFDRAYGDPKTPKNGDGDYPTVVPSRLGPVLLPFVCIYCELVQPSNRDNYTDKDRGFSWCPSCRGRYKVDPKGQPLKEDLPAGVGYAPALVKHGTETRVIGRTDGLLVLGAG